MSASRTKEQHDPTASHRKGLTLVGRKKVLAIVHTVTYTKRLLDVLALLENDLRVEVVFSAPPHVFGDEVPSFLRRIGIAALPWDEATRLTFDLALAAGPQGVGDVHAPVVTMAHGAAYVKRAVNGTGEPGVYGLRRVDIMPDGRTLPAVVALPHKAELAELAKSCPEALPVARVVGDPAHDRIVASLPSRSAYRRALGVAYGQKLVAVVSTWGPRSSFGLIENLLPRLTGELPADYRAAVLIHPNVWSRHSPWQIRTWLAECGRLGIAVVPPEADWRSVLVCADYIVGDHGSVTLYGTLTGAPILLTSSPEQDINPASPAAALARTAPALSPAYPLVDQLAYAHDEYDRQRAAYTAIAARISSEPGRFNERMGHVIYEVLGLGRPAHEPATRPLPVPPPLHTWTGQPHAWGTPA